MGFLKFILRIIRKCVKRITRLITGRCEIERAALANNHKLLGMNPAEFRVVCGTISRVPPHGERPILPTVQ